jgi:hypothetical protein
MLGLVPPGVEFTNGDQAGRAAQNQERSRRNGRRDLNASYDD